MRDKLIVCQALMLVEDLLGESPVAGEPADPQAVAQELGINFDGEQDWHYTKFWAFTPRNPGNSMLGVTFYTNVGASREEIIRRWNEKVAEFQGKSGISAP